MGSNKVNARAQNNKSRDWHDSDELNEKAQHKAHAQETRVAHKRNVKRRLEDYLETKRLRQKTSLLDDYDFEDDY